MRNERRWRVRPAEAADVPVLVPLLEAYMQETYGRAWGGSAAALHRDAFGSAFRIDVAVADRQLVGFVAWSHAYDLHHCVPGGEILDLFVVPAARSLGIAPALVCAVAEALQREGGLFLKGSVAGPGSAQRLYDRIAICHSGVECIVSGRAFRRLAELADAPVRQIARMLPQKSWSYEA